MAISLADAAHALDLDPAVLRRWLKREQIALLDHPTDHRRRMISREDFERLCRERENTLAPAPVAATEAPVQPIGGQFDVLRELLRESLRETVTKSSDATNTHIAALNNNLIELQDRIARLEERLAAERLEREKLEAGQTRP